MRKYPEGTTWLEVARDYQRYCRNDITPGAGQRKTPGAAQACARLQPHTITARDKPGMSAYQRTATLLMLKAFYDVVGEERVREGVRGLFHRQGLLCGAVRRF